MKNFLTILALSILTSKANALITPSDCTAGVVDSSCIHTIWVEDNIPGDVGGNILYDGAIAGVPATGNYYWGYDFEFPDHAKMYENRSSHLLTLVFTFTIPTGNCSDGCMPGMEFKLNNWQSFFPDMIRYDNKARVSIEIPPNSSYGWVIGLWQATEPHLTATIDGHSSGVSLADVGLPDTFNSVTRSDGDWFPCPCGDSEGWCYPGSNYSTGFVGPWYHDNYSISDAQNCAPH